ncbi:MAG: hypothetical protein JXB19_11810 [Bacteroidales bacterium]|nr:hypothetical protein [Bacteroidales bacterium]
MKTKTILTILTLLLILGSNLFAQDKTKALNETTMTWYGIDFSLAKFTLITEDPVAIVNQYFNAINLLVPNEPEKYDLKKYFNKSDVTIDLDQVTERNGGVNPASLVINEEHEITRDDVQAVVKSYNTGDHSGMGLVFIAENLNKSSQTGSYYVCFFDNATKEIIDASRMTGKAAGFGFRNYWAGSVYNVMKAWLKGK